MSPGILEAVDCIRPSLVSTPQKRGRKNCAKNMVGYGVILCNLILEINR